MTSSGWRVEFWAFNPSGTQLVATYTNSYQVAGCDEQYLEYYSATNTIYNGVLGLSTGGCTTFTQTYTFSGYSYGSTFTSPGALMESDDFTCSDFTGFGSVYFTSASYTLSSGGTGYPTFSSYTPHMPSCFSVTTGYQYATITYT